MATGFAVRGLGKGSIASLMKVGLEIVWIVLWVAAAGLCIALLIYVALIVLIQTGTISSSVLDPGGGTATFGPITIETRNQERLVAPLVAPAFLAGGVAVTGALIIVWRLKRLFKNFTSGEPFSRDNAIHLRVIWITMLVMELARYAIWAVITGVVMVLGQPETTEISVRSPINLTTWGAIFILIVLAEVFREGARLKEEQELTI